MDENWAELKTLVWKLVDGKIVVNRPAPVENSAEADEMLNTATGIFQRDDAGDCTDPCFDLFGFSWDENPWDYYY
jgi:hypothetical protein